MAEEKLLPAGVNIEYTVLNIFSFLIIKCQSSSRMISHIWPTFMGEKELEWG